MTIACFGEAVRQMLRWREAFEADPAAATGS